MDLERDAFILSCDPARLDRHAVIAAIEELGFTARFEDAPCPTADARTARSATPPDRATHSKETVPGPGGDRLRVGDGPPAVPGPVTTGHPANPPEPVAAALTRARADGGLVLVDFFAEWCAPCKVIEKRVLPAPEVQAALAGVTLVRVDTDAHPEAARAYGVVGMPTLLVLDAAGMERGRLVGPIGPADLVDTIEAARKQTATKKE
ncbi:MAG: thioredoxin domain-containing protein [Acidobacteriota bacterium]